MSLFRSHVPSGVSTLNGQLLIVFVNLLNNIFELMANYFFCTVYNSLNATVDFVPPTQNAIKKSYLFNKALCHTEDESNQR